MAALVMASPGKECGPCEKNCEHRFCIMVREEAESPCEVCGKPIGYETRFFYSHSEGKLIHAKCTA